ncbi:MAG: B12-binding domain-containing radical SAM protein [Planctomycetes bacterium]|nr:B12-binding domain-containing radical SAM protein [Planctomycetota bacterium]
MIGPPKGILYLAGVFKEDQDVETKMLDILAHPDFRNIKEEKETPLFYFGMDDKTIIKSIDDYKPHIIAITATANYYINDTIKLIILIRKNFAESFIALGGPDATNDYTLYFDKTTAIDAIVMGEGEVTFKELVDKLRSGQDWKCIKGIAYSDNNEIIQTEPRSYICDLDKYTPDYDIVDFDTYNTLNKKGYHSRLVFKYSGSEKSIDMVTSRGCPYACSFCCIHLHMGKEFRCHSVEHVLSEMEELVEKHDIRNIHFEDDNILWDLERFKNILRGIIAKGWSITWDTPNGVRADLIDDEFLQLCKKSGCAYLVFGVESGSKNILDNVVNKGLDLDRVIRACRMCYEYEIDTFAFYIFGMPGETKADVLKTYYFAFDLFKNYNTTPVYQLWCPYRNTELEIGVRNQHNITEPVLYSVHRKYRIPYTLFYSRVYEDEEITLKFLSSYFKKYLKDITKYAFINWLRITRRKPLKFVLTFFNILSILVRALFKPSALLFMLDKYVSCQGMLPFAQLNKLGNKK